VNTISKPTRWASAARYLTAAAVFLVAIVPAFAASARLQITQEDIDAAAAHRRQVSTDLEAATIEYDTAVNRLYELQDLMAALGTDLSNLERELAVARVAAQEIATQSYMFGDSGQSTLFDSVSIDDMSLRTSYLDRLSQEGSDVIARMFGLQNNYEEQQQRLAKTVAEQEATNTKLEAAANEIMSKLEAADKEYNDLVAAYEKQEAERLAREEAARKAAAEAEARRQAALQTTTTSPPASGSVAPPITDGMTCPVNGAVTFTDTWGAPRSGGRTHKGVDMIAAKGTPLVAIESGKIRKLGNGGLGGITVWITGNSGDQYYYAHLNAWADGLKAGQSVSVGDLVGYVGNTGNARYTVSHLHFEYHPGGGAAANPTPLVTSLCR
jgi:murein DD-endopeptidase MepM/ murein hydrolase activator NlpD